MKRAALRTLCCLMLATIGAGVAVASERDLATFDAVWSTVKKSFYDPDLHGVDWEAVRARYEPMLEDCASRDDVTFDLDGVHLTYGPMDNQGMHQVFLTVIQADGDFASVRPS